MHSQERQPGDRQELIQRMSRHNNARQRDRYWAVLLAIDRQPTRAIMLMLHRSRGSMRPAKRDSLSGSEPGPPTPTVDAARCGAKMRYGFSPRNSAWPTRSPKKKK